MAYGSYGGYGSGGTMRSPSLRGYLDEKKGSNAGSVYDRAIRQRQSSYGNPFYGIPGQLGGGREPSLARGDGSDALYPTPQQVQAYTNRTPPNSVASASPAPAPMQPQGATGGIMAGSGGMSQPTGVIGGLGGANAPQSGWQRVGSMVEALPPEYQKMWQDYWKSLGGGPDFEGSYEQQKMLASQYAHLLTRLASQAPVDFSVSSAIGDKYDLNRERLQNQLAARGISGSGVEAGALANTYGRQAAETGNLYSQLLEQRRRENLAQLLNFEQRSWNAEDRGLQKNWQEQADPGFWGDVGGVLGGVVGAAIPGIGGGIGKAIGGLFGSNAPVQSGYTPQYDYQYIDEANPWYGGYSVEKPR